MKKTYYLFNPGRLSRKDNTLKFVAVNEKGEEQDAKYIPIEDTSDLYVFGSLDANSALYNFLAKNQIAVHFFDYYEHYTGSFMPKDYLLAGKMQVEQTLCYYQSHKRIEIAQKIVQGSAFNILKNIKYYNNRDKDLDEHISDLETLKNKAETCETVPELMGIEGNIWKRYYSSFDIILKNFKMGQRTKQPPENEINTLISFGNMICYTTCLDAIYHTQLNPTISFLHEPGTRRYSLALDIAEIFKPIIVDRCIFKVINKGEITNKDFSIELNSCRLKDSGRKTFLEAYKARLEETIKHRVLQKNVSYKHLIKLECYKLAKHALGIETYEPLKIWW